MNPLRDYRNFSRGGGELSSNGESAKEIVANVLSQRDQGHAITDAQVLSAHPELSGELLRELGIADQIRQAMLAARRTTGVNQSLPCLTDSEFDDAIAASQNSVAEKVPEFEEVLPQIPGYFLVREINRGGQAAVYYAIQESTRRKVAIKVMSGGPFAGSRHRVRFEREARILAALDHPNIVSIIERGRTPDGSFFFVMPYIDGWPVDEYWTTKIPADSAGLRQLIQLFVKIALAVEEAHARGIIHRDLKPSNILVDHRGEPHILDFGLARPVGEASDVSAQTITVSGQIIGSLPWASPEQAAGRSMELDAVSDVYSIGVILFQSLTGDFPYSLKGPIDEVLLRIRTLKAAPPSRHLTVRPGVDGPLDAIALKCLAKLPTDRYQSAGCLKLDLEAWLAGDAILAAPPSPHRREWLLAVTVAVALLLIISQFAWKASQSEQPAVFKMPTLQNSIGMKFVRIPSGTFTMGSPSTEPGRSRDEAQHGVVVHKAFDIATTPVTQEQYESVMHENPSDLRWRAPGIPEQNVSYLQAVEFCRRLSQIDHAHYRLPTEVEWEYACRANSTRAFPDPDHPESSVFSQENSGGAVQPVARKSPNAWGLFDMQGNVYQWCSDLYNGDENSLPSPTSPVVFRAIRGGSALCEISKCRAASRHVVPETFQQSDLGFRVIRDP